MSVSAAYRPRTAFEIIDAAVQLVRLHPVPLMILAALITIPGLIWGLAVAPLVNAQPTQVEAGLMLGVFGGGLLALLWFFVGIAALASAAADAYLGRPVSPGASLKVALRRAGSLIGALLLVNLMAFVVVLLLMLGVFAVGVVAVLAGVQEQGATAGAFVGATAVFVGVFVFFVRYSVLPVAIVREGLGALDGMTRTTQLSKGARGRILAVMVIVMLIFLGVTLAVWSAVYLVVRNQVAASAAVNLAYLVLYPLVGSVLALLYYDLRIRKEGLDIELMAERVGGGGGAEQPAF